MKKLGITIILFSFFAFTGLQAQENENVKKETTIQKVTVKDTNVESVTDKEVKESMSVIKVEGTSETNQNSEEVIVKDEEKEVVRLIQKDPNLENQKDLEKLQKQENKMIDGQQRGTPTPASEDVKSKTQLTTKSKKDGGGN